jgi:phosphoribosylformylglycinamidine cyclo-ligase
MSLAASLLTPTRIYVKAVLAAMRATGGSGPEGAIKALAHITGGGLSENVPRVLPEGIGAEIDLGAWVPAAVFGWLKTSGNLDDAEMLRTFNCGIGLVIVADRAKAGAVLKELRDAGEAPMIIGRIAPARGVTSDAKGKGQAEAVHYVGQLRYPT